MYQKPTVRRFGTFRDLTLVGGNAAPSDGFSVYSTTVSDPVVVAAPACARAWPRTFLDSHPDGDSPANAPVDQGAWNKRPSTLVR